MRKSLWKISRGIFCVRNVWDRRAVRNSPKGPDRSGSLPYHPGCPSFPADAVYLWYGSAPAAPPNPGKAAASGRKIDMGGQFGFILPAGDGSSDHSGTVTVAHIVLHNQYRTDTALLRSHHRAEIRIVYFTSFYSHAPSRSEFFSFPPLIPAYSYSIPRDLAV